MVRNGHYLFGGPNEQPPSSPSIPSIIRNHARHVSEQDIFSQGVMDAARIINGDDEDMGRMPN